MKKAMRCCAAWGRDLWRYSGQAILEYAVLLAIVAAAFMAMAFYAQRAVQGRIYSMEGLTAAKSNQVGTSTTGGW